MGPGWLKAGALIKAGRTGAASSPAADGAGFVGRSCALRDLDRARAAALRGRAQYVLIAGEPGIGKTRLAEVAAERAQESGCRVEWARCWSEAGPTLAPWRQIIASLTSGPGGDERRNTLGPATADLAPLLDHNPVADAGDELARLRCFEAVRELLEEAARETALVVVLDDVHWADPVSLRLLHHLVVRTTSARLLLVTTCRDDEWPDTAGLHDLITDLGARATYISLAGLNADEVAELVAGLVGDEPITVSATALHTKTAGNPLFVREVVRLLDAQSTAAGGVPPTVRAVLQRRFARLPPATMGVLECAVTLGAEFTVETVAQVAGLPAAQTLDHLEPAALARLIIEQTPGRYVFSHALVRDTLCESLPSRRRQELHLRAGEVLEQRGTEPAVLAHHFSIAAPLGAAERAVFHCEAAARRALSKYGYEEAAGHCAEALELAASQPTDVDRTLRLMLLQGDALLRVGDLSEARRAYDQVADLARHENRPDDLVQAALGFASGLGGFEVRLWDQHQVDLLEEALASSGSDHPMRPWVLARLSVALSYLDTPERRESLAREAIAGARAAADPGMLAQALAAYCDAIADPDHVAERLAAAGEIVELARANRLREQELLGRRLLMKARLEMGDHHGAHREVNEYERLAVTLRQPTYLWYVPLWRGALALAEGQPAEAAGLTEEAARLGALAHSANARMLVATQRWAQALQALDHTPALQAMQAAYDELFATAPEFATMGYAGPMLALLRVEQGRLDEARSALAALPEINRDAEWLAWWFMVGIAAPLVGDESLAATAYDTLTPYAHLFFVDGIGAGLHGPVHHTLARLATFLGRRADAQDHYVMALRAAVACGATALADRIRQDAGDARTILAATSGRSSQSGSLRRDGESWAVGFDGHMVALRDCKGLHDLATLLRQPGLGVHALELVAATEGHLPGSLPGAGAGAPLLDRKAVAAYRSRLRELADDLTDAEQNSDSGRAGELRTERDFLLAELSSALGLGGRGRPAPGDPAERARKAVTARIRDVIQRLEPLHAPLARHLSASVRTGAFCSYDPERPVRWDT